MGCSMRVVRSNHCVVGIVGLLAVVALAACGSPAPADPSAPAAPAEPATITLYNGQHQDLATAWVEAFTRDTGINVEVRNGADFELANQILAEGAASPADVFITENSPALSMLSNSGVLAPLDPATLAQVPAMYASGAGDWVGVAARSTVLVYNPELVSPDELPTSIMELSEPQWRDRIGVAAGGADFQAIASAVYAVNGDAAAGQWLEGLKENARVYPNNITILADVNDGELPAGVIYHYYWYKDRAESGENSDHAQLEFFGHQDAGAFLSVSGAAVIGTSSDDPADAAAAQQFVAYMSGLAGQELLAHTDALEYPIGDGVAPNPELKPFAELEPPVVDLNTLNGPEIISEMQRVGLI